jgi:hypothetical protein
VLDAEAFRERLVAYGASRVREMIAEGRFGEEKVAVAKQWLQAQDEQPQAIRRWRGKDPAAGYQPTAGDLRYRNAVLGDAERNPFDEARLLRDISHEYLSALLSDNTGERSKGFRVQLEAELARRSGALAIRANRIALASLLTAIIALIVSIVAV